MSLATEVTPFTLRATSTALSMSMRELTKPLSWTRCLNVSTLISATLSDGSAKIAAFTLLVITESSTYSPVPSRVDVEAQPIMETMSTAAASAERRFASCCMTELSKNADPDRFHCTQSGGVPRGVLCVAIHSKRRANEQDKKEK